MSRGQSQPRNQPVRRVLERCKNRDTIEIIDVDKEKIDVVIVDAEETCSQGSGGAGTTGRNAGPTGVISIDDEDGDNNDTFRNVHTDVTNKETCPASNNSSVSEESRSDECLMTTGKSNPMFKSMEYMSKYHGVGPSVNRFGLGFSSESYNSDSDSSEFSSGSISSDGNISDCEIIEDSSGIIREQWERAASKKKTSGRWRFGSDPATASWSSGDSGLSPGEETHINIDVENCIKKIYYDHSKEIPAKFCSTHSSGGKEDTSFNIAGDVELGDSLYKRNIDTEDLEVDAATNICHSEPEQSSRPTRENLSYNQGPHFRDPEVMCTSVCQMNMQNDPNIQDDSVSSTEQDESVSTATTFGADELLRESSFWGKLGPCPVKLFPRNPQPNDGGKFTVDSTIQDNIQCFHGNSSCSMQPQCDSRASPGSAWFQEKDKPSFDVSSPCNFHYPDDPTRNVDGETTIEEPPCCNTNKQSPQPNNGEKFTVDSTIQDNMKCFHGESSCSMQPQCDSRASPESVWFQEKDKSSFDGPSSCNYHYSDGPPRNVDGETTIEEPPCCNTNKQNPQPNNVEKFTVDSTIQNNKKCSHGESSCSMQPQCDSRASPGSVWFQEKDKSSFDAPSSGNYHYSDGPPRNVDGETTLKEPPCCNTNKQSGTGVSVPDKESDAVPEIHSGLICERERHKESDEYRRAVEEEWAARQRQLQIQAEEAQRLKRKRKAATLRLLDMERRQKQRLEEVRESQKKDEETINLKEHIRAEVMKELDKIELRVLVIPTDISDCAESKRLIDETIAHFGQLNHLVANAGFFHSCLFEEITNITAFRQVMDVNFWGAVYPTYYALPHLKKSRGNIIVTASMAGRVPTARMSFYNASKASLIRFFETLRAELGSEVKITILTLGYVASELTQGKGLQKGGEFGVNEEVRDVQIGPLPVGYTDKCADVIVDSARRGDAYVTWPSWYKPLHMVMCASPELVNWFSRSFYVAKGGSSSGKALSQKILDATGAKKFLYPASIRSGNGANEAIADDRGIRV